MTQALAACKQRAVVTWMGALAEGHDLEASCSACAQARQLAGLGVECSAGGLVTEHAAQASARTDDFVWRTLELLPASQQPPAGAVRPAAPSSAWALLRGACAESQLIGIAQCSAAPAVGQLASNHSGPRLLHSLPSSPAA